MADYKKSKDLGEVHGKALERYKNITDVLYTERMNNSNDRRFAFNTGSQWESALGNYFDSKIRLEVNKIPQALERVYTQWCQNSVDVKFLPKDGSDADDLSDVCNKLFRADEHDSHATDCYRNSFRDALAGGFSAFRLTSCYEDDSDPDNESKRVKFFPIKDADTSVFFDLNSKLQDKSDAKFAFILYFLTRAEYEEEFDRSCPTSFPKPITTGMFDWFSPAGAYICEYYSKEEVNDWVLTYYVELTDQQFIFKKSEMTDEDRTQMDLLAAQIVKRRKITKTRIRKYIMDGNEILEDCGFIPGDQIPIVPVYGHVTYIDNIERCWGIVRFAKDIQRLKNAQVSKLAEIAALSSAQKPILFPEQIAGHQQQWAEDNLKNYPYLLLNPITDANGAVIHQPPMAYTQPPQVPPSIGALLDVTEMDIQDMLGKPASQLTQSPNVSGYAMEIQQNIVESPNQIYLDNFQQAIRRAGQIWLSMARELYIDEGRSMKGVDKNGNTSKIELMVPYLTEEGGIGYDNDLSRAKYDIFVEVGAKSSTQRQAIVRNITNILPNIGDEQTRAALTATLLQNLEGEGVTSLREYARKQLVQMGIEEPNEQDIEEQQAAMENQEPNAEQQYLTALAENELSKSVKNRADTERSLADTDKIKAQTIEILSKTEGESAKTSMEILEKLEKGPSFTPDPSKPYIGEQVFDTGPNILEFIESDQVPPTPGDVAGSIKRELRQGE